MKSARKLGLAILLLISYLAPAMACMVSDMPMNAEERACCRAMKYQCQQMGMPASHGCCQKTPRSAHENALNTKAASHHPIAAAVIWLSAAEWLNRNPIVKGWVEHADYSPPESPPASISVLRI